jgi:Holliday junction resolvase RusA-like endonuclease
MSANVFRVEVPGKPIAQARPRYTTVGGHARAYDTAPVKAHKDYFRMMCAQNRPPEPFTGALRVEIRLDIERPKSWPKRRVHASTKPDVDNMAKLCLDAMEGIVYKNDSQVVELNVVKQLIWCGPELTTVKVEELE